MNFKPVKIFGSISAERFMQEKFWKEEGLHEKLIIMATVTRRQVLDTLIRHETLTIKDIADPVNIGFSPDKGQLKFILAELQKSGHISVLHGVDPTTYTITDKGIEEGKS